MARLTSKKLDKWLQLSKPLTRDLAHKIRAVLVPWLESRGFVEVEFLLKDPKQTYPGRMLEFERWGDTFVDSVSLNFDKYMAPRFQIHCSRRLVERPNQCVRHGNLVDKPSTYLHFWGKPWWLPLAFWSENRSARIVAIIESKLVQITEFLENGNHGENISRPT